MESEGSERPEHYRAGGVVPGVVGIVTGVGLFVFGVVSDRDGFAPWAFPLLLAFGLLSWAFLVRPAVLLHRDELELRNVLHSQWIPFERMDDFQVKQVTRVRVGERTYVGAGLGRSRRAMVRDARAGADQGKGQHSLGWLVEEKVNRRMHPHDAVAGEGEVRRTWAVPEIAALVVLALSTLVALLVA